MINGGMQVLYSVPAPIFYPLILVYLTPFLMRAFSYDFSLNVDVLIITFRTLDDGFNFFPPVLTVDSLDDIFPTEDTN